MHLKYMHSANAVDELEIFRSCRRNNYKNMPDLPFHCLGLNMQWPPHPAFDRHVSKDYILIFLSEKPPTTFYDLPDFEHCWLNSDRIIPIRYTNERIQELQKFCPEKFSMN